MLALRFICFACNSGDIRNDIYLTLRQGDFSRGAKTTDKNVDITVHVCDYRGKVMKVGGVGVKGDYHLIVMMTLYLFVFMVRLVVFSPGCHKVTAAVILLSCTRCNMQVLRSKVLVPCRFCEQGSEVIAL